mgnify:CR=1 FL=1
MCALLSLFAHEFGSKNVASFKCGPDFIDPLLHSRVLLEEASGNLDIFFSGEEGVLENASFLSEGKKIALIEGAMGYFDGTDFSTKSSAWHLASVLCAPAVLVFDARGSALSICAKIEGFTRFREKNGDRSLVSGVILNRCSKKIYEKIAPKIESECNVSVLGFLPFDEEIAFPSRRLGLFTPEAMPDFDKKIERLFETAQKTLDVQKILQIAQSSVKKTQKAPIVFEKKATTVKIAVPRDEAFCFYYRENLDLLKKEGAEIAFFSPLKNECVPVGSCALYIGGGYPELFASKLIESRACADSIRAFVRSGGPTLAECGGFLYLKMLGLLSGTFFDAHSLVRFGHIELCANEDSFLCKKGEKIRAHEFHHFDTSENGNAFLATAADGRNWNCIQVAEPVRTFRVCCKQNHEKNIVAGFPHLYFPSNPIFAKNFVLSALVFDSLKSSDSSCTSCTSCGNCKNCH